MYPPLILERLATEHQRDRLDEAAHERVAAALVGHRGPWWQPIVTRLRYLAVAGVRRWSSADVGRQVAVADRA